MNVKKIVVASDSFKGTLSSACIARVFADELAGSGVRVIGVPLADGGEGTVDCLAQTLGGRDVSVDTVDPLGRGLTARYLLSGDGTALIEVAAACGLPLLAEAERNPMKTTTEGVGIMIADALSRGASRLIIGLGGSATVDGGVGMMGALGARFYDSHGHLTGLDGESMTGIAGADFSGLDPRLQQVEIELICDVTAPLVGPRGAAAVFGPQKGADAAMVGRLDRGLSSLAALLKNVSGVDTASMTGAGAAGGIGAPLIALCGARLSRGIDRILELIGFETIIADADLVVTGEGRLDGQSFMGKTVSGVMRAAAKAGVNVVIITGSVDPSLDLRLLPPVIDINEGRARDGSELQPDVACRRLRRAAKAIGLSSLDGSPIAKG